MIPLPKESKAIFNPLFVKDAANAIDKIVKSKTFHGKLFELFGPKSYSWEELMIFFKKNIQSKVFLIKVPITLLSFPALFFGFLPKPLTSKSSFSWPVNNASKYLFSHSSILV